MSYNKAWYTPGGILSSKDVISKSYSPFGEQIGEASSGFGYNGEYYNAATGMVYLRARFYEPEMNRFNLWDEQVIYVWTDKEHSAELQSQQYHAVHVPGNSGRPQSCVLHECYGAGQPCGPAGDPGVSGDGSTCLQANTAHNTNIARQAYQTSQFSVNRVNNVATGRLPNTYMPYDSSGNATSYYNRSRQAGKTPSPDAPRVEDVSGENIKYCEQDNSSLDNLWAQIKELLKDSSVVGISNSLIAFILSYEGAVAGYLKGAYETAKHLANKAAIVRNLSIATKAIPVVSTVLDTTLQVVDGDEFGHAIIKSTALL